MRTANATTTSRSPTGANGTWTWRATGCPTTPPSPTSGAFPRSRLPAGGVLAIHCSGEDRRDDPAHLHANFKLSKGETVYLSQPDGKMIDRGHPARAAGGPGPVLDRGRGLGHRAAAHAEPAKYAGGGAGAGRRGQKQAGGPRIHQRGHGQPGHREAGLAGAVQRRRRRRGYRRLGPVRQAEPPPQVAVPRGHDHPGPRLPGGVPGGGRRRPRRGLPVRALRAARRRRLRGEPVRRLGRHPGQPVPAPAVRGRRLRPGRIRRLRLLRLRHAPGRQRRGRCWARPRGRGIPRPAGCTPPASTST